MRLSMDEYSSYPPEKAALCHQAVIFLNNVEVKNCITADEEQGYVEVYKVDNFGQVIVEDNKVLVREKLYGFVQIVIPKA